jgi:ABC-2 type transport system ATP-binding protein
MKVVEAENLKKSFGQVQAVANVSFAVQQGEIFDLLGPNGAGKTTTIRLLLDIFKPDAGSVSILDGPMTEAKKDLIGYMPEERGLYQDMQLESCLAYLGSLKGLSAAEVKRRVGIYLARFDLAQHRRKKVKELSRGMQQKAQVINTVLSEPQLLIIDEPFSGLDPVNTQLVKELLLELRDRGTTIIMSTHMMNKVEELCDRIVLIDNGYNVLYGPLGKIRREYTSNAVLVRVAGELPPMQGVSAVLPQNGAVQLMLDGTMTPMGILSQMVGQAVNVEQFEIATPTLDEIFIEVVRKQKEGA